MMKEEKKLKERPPVIVIMGHIDHGKSTLLDFIRKENVVDKEAGGITQHVGSYELVHTDKSEKEHKMTFLDTPGHESFRAIRRRGADVADIAILVVSAEDGVKPQTLEAYECIKNEKMPFIVAINKIDKAGADVERTKQNLAENEIFVEGYGGHVSWAPISAKSGDGIPDLLDLIILTAEMEELKGDENLSGEGVVIESHMDTKKGIACTVVIKNGTVKKGGFAVSGESLAPLRIMEDFAGKNIDSATFSSPIRIIGWDKLPKVGEKFQCFDKKQDALDCVKKYLEEKKETKEEEADSLDKKEIPIILKADTAGSLEALMYEIEKIPNERVSLRITSSGVGPISEGDIKYAGINDNALVIGFHTKVDSRAESLALRMGITINTFDIIYKLTEWLAQAVQERTPSIEVEETLGTAKILKTFSAKKDRQIIGGKVESGTISSGGAVKILRREVEVGKGHVRELQRQKQKVGSVTEPEEFGTEIESKITIAPGDKIESFSMVKK